MTASSRSPHPGLPRSLLALAAFALTLPARTLPQASAQPQASARPTATAPPAAAARPQPAHQALRLDELLIVGRAAPDQPWTNRPTEARLDQRPELAVIARAHLGRRAVLVADPELETIELGGRRVSAAQRVPWALAGEVEVEWRSVEPHGFRTVAAAANGATSRYYSNVSTEPASFGRWLGYDTIEYFEVTRSPRGKGAAARRLLPELIGSDEPAPRPADTAGLGTLRFRAVALLPDGRSLATPGADATDTAGIRPAVHRVSVRAGDDFLGWLGAYLLVPEVFGSAGGGPQHQTERMTGADCADVLVGALRRSGRRDVPYSSVAALPRYATQVEAAVTLDEHGRPERQLDQAQVGDLIRIDYGGSLTGHTPRSWDHVAAWWRDTSDPQGPTRGGPDGRLDGFDLVVHMGHPRLVLEPLANQAPATIDVLRWRPRGHGARPTRQ